MPKTVQKTLTFPQAGVSRLRSYRVQVRPYSSPWAVNVRNFGADENRERGGVRPGIVKVSSGTMGVITALATVTAVSGSTRTHYLAVLAGGKLYSISSDSLTTIASSVADGVLQTDDGTPIVTDDGTEIVFDFDVSSVSPVTATGAHSISEWRGRLLVADSYLRVFTPGGAVVKVNAAPTGQPLVCVYRDRIVLSGADHLWYASRQGYVGDWDFGADMNDTGKAVAGELSLAGRIGDIPIALIPVEDKVLVFACANSLWILRGDPATGSIDMVSDGIGIVSEGAWAKGPDGTVAFLSNDGVYLWSAGSSTHPVRFSKERIPDMLQDVDTDSNIVTMSYDHVGRGFNLFITPSTGTGTHWWIDVENKALWPVVLQSDHQPVAVTSVSSGGLAEPILGCADGYLRKFSRTVANDDGSSIQSHLLIGPIKLAANDVNDAMLAEIHGIMGGATSASISWGVFIGDSAESVTDTAITAVEASLASESVVGEATSGTWAIGRNNGSRERCRGSWLVLWVHSTDKWSFEAVAVVARQLGRLRG